jgi:hypothetical protein
LARDGLQDLAHLADHSLVAEGAQARTLELDERRRVGVTGQHVDRLAQPRYADVGVGDRNLRQLIPGHFQSVAIDACDALQVRIVEQDGMPVDRQLDVETEMACAEF